MPDLPMFEIHRQQRLYIGPFQLVPELATRPHAPVVWALPGGGRANIGELLALARRRGWKRPRVLEVEVRYRMEMAAQCQRTVPVPGSFLTSPSAMLLG